jgi:hypothetical protein
MYLIHAFEAMDPLLWFRYQKIRNIILYRMRHFLLGASFCKYVFSAENIWLVPLSIIYSEYIVTHCFKISYRCRWWGVHLLINVRKKDLLIPPKVNHLNNSLDQLNLNKMIWTTVSSKSTKLFLDSLDSYGMRIIFWK